MSENIEELFKLGAVYMGRGDNGAANSYFDKALEIRPVTAREWIINAFIYDEIGMINDSLACYDEAFNFENDKAKKSEICCMKGVFLTVEKRYYEALKCFNRSLEINFDYAPAWSLKGYVLKKLEDEKGSEECFNKAKELNKKEIGKEVEKRKANSNKGKPEQNLSFPISPCQRKISQDFSMQ